MKSSSSSNYIIISVSDISYPLDSRPIHQNLNRTQLSETIGGPIVESDCACSDGSSQSIILMPPKEQETASRDPK